jgi:hypothetical protein
MFMYLLILPCFLIGKSAWSGVIYKSLTEVHWEFVAQIYSAIPHTFLLSLTDIPLKLIPFPEKIFARKHFIHIFVNSSISSYYLV